MERLTATVTLPKDGEFRECSLKEREEIKRNSRISLEEIYRRLQKYENTGLTPEEITLNKSIIGDLGREVCREGREIKKLRELLKAAVTSLKCMADIVREVHKDDCICGMCEFDFDTTVGESGECYGECPGFERNDCFRWKHANEVEEILKEGSK